LLLCVIGVSDIDLSVVAVSIVGSSVVGVSIVGSSVVGASVISVNGIGLSVVYVSAIGVSKVAVCLDPEFWISLAAEEKLRRQSVLFSTMRSARHLVPSFLKTLRP
jgi:hypothetical protein